MATVAVATQQFRLLLLLFFEFHQLLSEVERQVDYDGEDRHQKGQNDFDDGILTDPVVHRAPYPPEVAEDVQIDGPGIFEILENCFELEMYCHSRTKQAT